MKLTIKDIANEAGVSTTTVSQILNGKGDRFSEKTKAKVLAVVEEHQYMPDFFARNMVKKNSKTIGMIVPDGTDFFFSKIIEGAESYLNPLGYMMILCNSKHSESKEKECIEELVQRSVDGILLATPNSKELSLNNGLIQLKKIPYVLIDRGKNNRNEGKLIVEEYRGTYQLIEYLLKQGHRRIGMLREKEGYYQLSERISAYRNCLKDNDVCYDEKLIAKGELNIQGGYEAAKDLLSRQKVTAIFCGNDEMAVGAYQAIYETGRKVPEDISVVGFDDLEIARYLVPPLTTVHQPIFDIGYTAGEFIVQAIETPLKKLPNKTFDTHLIKRKSVSCLTE